VASISVRTPKYRLHKPTKQAVVTLDGRDVYLGRHRSPENQAEYARLVAEGLSNGRRLTGSRHGDLTVNEVILPYLRYAEGYYVKNASPPQNPRILHWHCDRFANSTAIHLPASLGHWHS
jgi:hypothetical protein